jgi:hypothetical protein
MGLSVHQVTFRSRIDHVPLMYRVDVALSCGHSATPR